MYIEKELALVERAKVEPAAFGELYDLYYPKIFNYILRRVGSVEVAQDLTTIMFMKVLEQINKFVWRGAPFSSWLYRIASNEIANYYRGKNRRALSLDVLMEEQGFEPLDDIDIEQAYIDAQEKVERHEQFVLVQKLLRQLPLKYQESLALRYFEKKSIEEISQIMNKRPGTIKSLLSRGVKRLREAYEVQADPIKTQPSSRNRVSGNGDKKP